MLEATPVGTQENPLETYETRAEWIKGVRRGTVERPRCKSCSARLRSCNAISGQKYCDPCQEKRREKYTVEVPAAVGTKRQPMTEAKLKYADDWNRTHQSRMIPGLHNWLDAEGLTNAQGYQRYEQYMRAVGCSPLCWTTWENYVKVKVSAKPMTIAHLSNVTGYSEEKLING